MDINDVIKEVSNYIIESTLKLETKSLEKTEQKNFLDGQIGIMFYNGNNEETVYLFIKHEDKIASPLLLRIFEKHSEAEEYYAELKKLINNDNPCVILDKIKCM